MTCSHGDMQWKMKWTSKNDNSRFSSAEDATAVSATLLPNATVTKISHNTKVRNIIGMNRKEKREGRDMTEKGARRFISFLCRVRNHPNCTI